MSYNVEDKGNFVLLMTEGNSQLTLFTNFIDKPQIFFIQR